MYLVRCGIEQEFSCYVHNLMYLVVCRAFCKALSQTRSSLNLTQLWRVGRIGIQSVLWSETVADTIACLPDVHAIHRSIFIAHKILTVFERECSARSRYFLPPAPLLGLCATVRTRDS